MVQRPAFLARLASRVPDLSSLRFRFQAGAGLVGGAFGLCLVLAATHLDARRCAEVARERAETLAQTAGMWLDGDAHAGLGTDPEKRLGDLQATLEKLLAANGYPGTVRTLRPKAEHKETLAARPGSPRAAALEVVLQTGKNVVRQDVDYRPEMRAALFEGGVTSRLEGGRILAYAAVPDAWGGTPALITVEGPASAPLWRRIVFPLGAALFAGLLAWGVVLLARRMAESLIRSLALLESGAQALGAGGAPAIQLPRHSARELVSLGETLESLRFRPGAGAPAQPQAAALPAADPLALGGEAAEFDLALLMQQLVEPARGLARSRGIEVQLVFPDGLPAQLVGHPMVLFRALDSLLRSALRTTRQGRITLRVSRASVAGDAKLRFEVADTSPGIPFKEQQELSAALAAAASAPPESLQDPLQLASALAASLGGELTFVSQPGQGSRFGFTLGFAGLAPADAPLARTGFQPAPGTAFQPRSGIPLGPPASSFQPRPNLQGRRAG